MFNEMFEFFIENKLISSSQSGFKPGDSCINQLLSITHEVYSSFDKGLEVRSIFLDIAKAFDKVWHDDIIFKLTQNSISGNLLNLLRDFLNERKQRVILNGQFSTWKNVSAGVPQGSILGSLLFLIYINDLTEGLSTNAKLFADDTSLFSVIHDTQTSANNLNKDLERISNWATQWKMNFNPDSTKQAQEVIFSRKVKKTVHPPLLFHNASVTRTSSHKHLGIILDNQLKFDDHIKMVFRKISKTIGLLRKLHNFVLRAALITIYKAFIRPHLDYGDILYDEAYNMSFHQKMESIQYNACLAITGAIRGTSKEKIYQELGLESLQSRRWYRKLGMFYKISKSKSPQYLFNLIPEKTSSYVTRNAEHIPLLNIKHNFYKNSFFPSSIIEWNNLDPKLRNSENLSTFKNNVLKFIRPKPNSFFNCCNLKGIRLITRLRLELSHLSEHKFKYNFRNCLNPLCSCGLSIGSTSHFLLHCPIFHDKRHTLLSTLDNIDSKILESNDSYLTQTFLFGSTSFDSETNTLVLNATIDYILSTERFEQPLF